MDKPATASPAPQDPSALHKGVVPILVVLLAGVSTAGLLYVGRESRQEKELVQKNQALQANLSQMQTQLQALNDKLAALSRPAETAPIPPPPPAPVHVAVAPRVRKPQPAPRPNPEDDRLKQIQSRLNRQQEEIAGTRDQVEKTRSDLEDKLVSTRDDLNLSIARTHEEVVALQKRGERNYYEFDLAKKKDFQRVGPISLSLRKANTKRKSYDLALMVDDQQLQKKSVNLYEPLSIAGAAQSQPVNLVVTEIGKDRIRGYVSEPKYQQTALSAGPAAAAPGELQRR
jgi:septal ring factor EnvC (AmiA/AmiB activator)